MEIRLHISAYKKDLANQLNLKCIRVLPYKYRLNDIYKKQNKVDAYNVHNRYWRVSIQIITCY